MDGMQRRVCSVRYVPSHTAGIYKAYWFYSIRHTTVPLLLGGIAYYPPGTSTGFFFPSCLLSPPFFFSLPPSRNSDPGPHSRLFSPCPPSPLRFVPCIFIASIFQPFLPSSTRVEPCLPSLGLLSNYYSDWSSFMIANKFNTSPRRDSNSRTNTIT